MTRPSPDLCPGRRYRRRRLRARRAAILPGLRQGKIRRAFYVIFIYARNKNPQKALTKTRPHPRPLSHGERGHASQKTKKPHSNPDLTPSPSPMGRGGMLHKKQKKPHSNLDLTPGPSPMGRGEHASQKTKKLHQTPTSPPAPLPWGEGSMLHKKQKKPSPKNTKRPHFHHAPSLTTS